MLRIFDFDGDGIKCLELVAYLVLIKIVLTCTTNVNVCIKKRGC